jgi:hypothetical protein
MQRNLRKSTISPIYFFPYLKMISNLICELLLQRLAFADPYNIIRNPMDGHLRQRYAGGTGTSYLAPTQPQQTAYYQNSPYSSWQTHVNPSDYYGESPISPTLTDPNNNSAIPSPTTNGRGLKRSVDAVYSNDSSYHPSPYSPNLEPESLSHNGSSTEPSKRVKIESGETNGKSFQFHWSCISSSHFQIPLR